MHFLTMSLLSKKKKRHESPFLAFDDLFKHTHPLSKLKPQKKPPKRAVLSRQPPHAKAVTAPRSVASTAAAALACTRSVPLASTPAVQAAGSRPLGQTRGPG